MSTLFSGAEPEFKLDFASYNAELESLTNTNATAQAELEKADPMGTGFLWYTPPMAPEQVGRSAMTGEGHQWIISGHDMQALTITIPPGETITTEVGSFFFGSSDIETNVDFTCCQGSEGIYRICGGESCVKVMLNNAGSQTGYVGLTPNFPAKVIPLKFGTHVKEDAKLIAKPGSYMAQLGEVNVSCDLDCSPLRCCCAGLGCCRQTISGPKDSIAFVAAGGTLVYRHLKEGETVVVDTNSVVLLEESVSLGVQSNGRFCMCCCGGEGCCYTTLTGPGKVFLQSMNLEKFAAAVTQTVVVDRGAPAADPTAVA